MEEQQSPQEPMDSPLSTSEDSVEQRIPSPMELLGEAVEFPETATSEDEAGSQSPDLLSISTKPDLPSIIDDTAMDLLEPETVSDGPPPVLLEQMERAVEDETPRVTNLKRAAVATTEEEHPTEEERAMEEKKVEDRGVWDGQKLPIVQEHSTVQSSVESGILLPSTILEESPLEDDPNSAQDALSVANSVTGNSVGRSDDHPLLQPSSDGMLLSAPRELHGIPVLPRFEHTVPPPYGYHHPGAVVYPPLAAPPPSMMVMNGVSGRRKILLRLEQEVETPSKRGLLGHIRQRSNSLFGSRSKLAGMMAEYTVASRGDLTVSWFDGTSSLELQEHVRKSLRRKLKLPEHIELEDLRVLDESAEPAEEIVLSPFIPDGSRFLLRFCTKDTTANDGAATPASQYSQFTNRPPESPSAAPSPHPNRGTGLSTQQLLLLQKQLNGLSTAKKQISARELFRDEGTTPRDGVARTMTVAKDPEEKPEVVEENGPAVDENEDVSDDDLMDEVVHGDANGDDPVEARLRQITELLIQDRQRRKANAGRRQSEKRQVIFVLANYFVLFLSLIAISAEVHARAPSWLEWMETQMKQVSTCAADKDSLMTCVENGDFAGLIAAVILWMSRSVATKQFFLFGFDSPQKLWTVVYECIVTSVCWGFSYLFIRRAMNPDTRSRFIQKYWKDAVYGSLAGFNAAFMKHVLKNLIPQEAVEDALRDRQLKILTWFPNFNR